MTDPASLEPKTPISFSFGPRDLVMGMFLLLGGAAGGGGISWAGDSGVKDGMASLSADVKELKATVQAALRKGDETAGSLNFLRERSEENRKKIDDVEQRLLFLERGR